MEWTEYTFGNGAKPVGEEAYGKAGILFNETLGMWELFDSTGEVTESYAYPEHSLQEAIAKATQHLKSLVAVEQLCFRSFPPEYMSFDRSGWNYRFDLRWAAHEYALYYAISERNFEKSYNEEFQYAIASGEAEEWARNNMDPSDFPAEFVKIEQIEVSHDPTNYAAMSWNPS